MQYKANYIQSGRLRNKFLRSLCFISYLIFFAGVGLLVFGGWAPASAAAPSVFPEDQVNYLSPTNTSASCGTPNPDPFYGDLNLYQSFKPDSSNLSRIELLFRTSGSFSSPYQIKINIRSGSPGGSIVATASTNVVGSSSSYVWATFFFLPPITLDTNNTYIIEWDIPAEPDVPPMSWVYYETNPYPDGTGFGCTGESNPAQDFIFKTYSIAADAQIIFHEDFQDDDPGFTPTNPPGGYPPNDSIATEFYCTDPPSPAEPTCPNTTNAQIIVANAGVGGFETQSLEISRTQPNNLQPTFLGYPDPVGAPYNSGVFTVVWRSSSPGIYMGEDPGYQPCNNHGATSILTNQPYFLTYNSILNGEPFTCSGWLGYLDGNYPLGVPNPTPPPDLTYFDTEVDWWVDVPQTFEAVVDKDTELFDLYIDGRLVAENRPFQRTFAQLEAFYFRIFALNSTETYYIDDITILYQPPPTAPDSDLDGVEDGLDSCVDKPNGPLLGTCVEGFIGNTCTSDTDCGGILGSCLMTQISSDMWYIDPYTGNPCEFPTEDTVGDPCDPDDDNDGICDPGIPANVSSAPGAPNGCLAVAGGDPSRVDPNVCGDSDKDGCDDCANLNDDFGTNIDYAPDNDGLDTDEDGICDSGDNCIENPNAPSDGTCVYYDLAGDIVQVGSFCTNSEDCTATSGGICNNQNDSDGDGVGDVCDNCPNPGDVNPRQEDTDFDDIGNKCDPSPLGPGSETDDQVNGVQFVEFDPLDGGLVLDAEVTFIPPEAGEISVFPPTPYSIVVRMFTCEDPPVELIADQVLCGPPCSLENLVTIDEPATYSAQFPIDEWFKVQTGCFTAEAWYVNYCDDLDKDVDGNCTLDTPDNPPPAGESSNCEGDILLTETLLGSDKFEIQDGTIDQCPDVDGNTAGTGCPFADRINVKLHSITQGEGASTKEPLAGVKVHVVDRNNSIFQSMYGKNPKGSEYPEIYKLIGSEDEGFLGACTTGADGTCYVGEKQTGDYLVIIKWYDDVTKKTVYVGRPKGPEDFVDGIATKDLQIIYMEKKNGEIVIKGGKKTVVLGSYLEIISPESAIWEGTESVYPFIFTSDSDWAVDLCARVPEGYSIVGVYDDTGNLIPAAECIQTFVNGETKVVAFEVEEIGSPEPWLDAVLNVKSPKGKKVKKKMKTFDLRKKTFNSNIRKARAKLRDIRKLENKRREKIKK